jgi:hypothetical protein
MLSVIFTTVLSHFSKLLSHFRVVGDARFGRGGSWLHRFCVQDQAVWGAGSRGTEPQGTRGYSGRGVTRGTRSDASWLGRSLRRLGLGDE